MAGCLRAGAGISLYAMTTRLRHPRLVALWASVALLSWGSAYPIVRIVMHDIAPVPLAAVRYAIAALLSVVWLLAKRAPLPRMADIPRLVACGGIGISLYNVLFNTGELSVSAGAASLLISSAPLMAAAIAVAVMGERLTPWGWAGSLISFAGVITIAGGEPGGLSFGSGTTLVLGAALASALYTTMQKRLIQTYGAMNTTAYVLIVGALVLLPWLPRALATVPHMPVMGKLGILQLGVLPAFVGYAAWTWVVGEMGVARASGLLYLLPPVTLVESFVLVHEVPEPRTLLGGGVVMAGVFLANTLGRAPVRRLPPGGE